MAIISEILPVITPDLPLWTAKKSLNDFPGLFTVTDDWQYNLLEGPNGGREAFCIYLPDNWIRFVEFQGEWLQMPPSTPALAEFMLGDNTSYDDFNDGFTYLKFDRVFAKPLNNPNLLWVSLNEVRWRMPLKLVAS